VTLSEYEFSTKQRKIYDDRVTWHMSAWRHSDMRDLKKRQKCVVWVWLAIKLL